MQKKNNKGFSLIELIITIAILSVLTGITAYSAASIHTDVKGKKYMTEADTVYRAVELFILDKVAAGETEDIDLFLIELMGFDFAMPDHPLTPYLSGSVTKGAVIQRIEAFKKTELKRIEYLVDGYVIEVTSDRKTAIYSYPESVNNRRRKNK